MQANTQNRKETERKTKENYINVTLHERKVENSHRIGLLQSSWQ